MNMECIDACNQCANLCDICAASCLQEQDVAAMAQCIRWDIDCAAICRLAAGFMARSGPLESAVCRVCAEVCERCGQECAKHPADHCQRCAEGCRRCAEMCRQMAA